MSEAPTSGPRLFTFEQFHTLRNEILSILFRYGTVGPNGELCTRDSVGQSIEVWARDVVRHPDFYVVSDILLDELAMTLIPTPDWCLYLALTKGGLTVFSNRILFEGAAFAGCRSSRRFTSAVKRANRVAVETSRLLPLGGNLSVTDYANHLLSAHFRRSVPGVGILDRSGSRRHR